MLIFVIKIKIKQIYTYIYVYILITINYISNLRVYVIERRFAIFLNRNYCAHS